MHFVFPENEIELLPKFLALNDVPGFHYFQTRVIKSHIDMLTRYRYRVLNILIS
jgi:hypothetical protein